MICRSAIEDFSAALANEMLAFLSEIDPLVPPCSLMTFRMCKSATCGALHVLVNG